LDFSLAATDMFRCLDEDGHDGIFPLSFSSLGSLPLDALSLRSVRFGAIEFILAATVFFSFVRLSLGSGSFSPLFLSDFSVGSFSRLLSLVSSLQRHFLLDTFAEKASNGSLWIRLVRSFPTRVSSLLSAGFFFPSRRLTFDEMR